MAKFECIIPESYDFDETLNYFHQFLSSGSISSSYEDGSDYRAGDLRVAVRIYEKYTLMGNNRMSMTVTLVSNGTDIFVSAISAAGGGGLVKIWAWGEDGYLEDFIQAAKKFQGMRPVTHC